MLAFTETAFGLPYLTTKDAAAYNCASSFNYAQAPAGSRPADPIAGVGCGTPRRGQDAPRSQRSDVIRRWAESLQMRQKAQLRLIVDRARVGGTQPR